MDHYELVPGVYRIQAGVGSDGEIFGAILLQDNPTVIIGCSGGLKFVKALDDIISDLKINNEIRIYFPSVTFNEIYTANLVKKKFPEVLLYVHVKLVELFKQPEENILKRYFVDSEAKNYFSRQLPSTISDVIGFDKAGSFETENTKLLFIPFSGPHEGHSFIYSRDHKLLCAGLALSRTSDTSKYYIDNSGSLIKFEDSLSFLEKARSEIIFPIYDEPEFTSSLKFKVEDMRAIIKTDRERILELCTLKPKTIDDILEEYMSLYGEKNYTKPYDLVDLNKTKIFQHLEALIVDKKITKHEDQYILKK